MIFDQLKERGEAFLLELIANSHQESFGLEFKQKEDPKTSKLSKNDKRNLGAALSAFSNADGGVIIFGVGTKKEEGVDVAAEALPIVNIGRFKASITSLIGEYLRPENPSIVTLAIPSTDRNDTGYLAIQIGKSEMRPHMSMAPDHQKYFRRGVDSTRAMDHSEIRDMMMAPRQAQLGVDFAPRTHMIRSGGNYRIADIRLGLVVANDSQLSANAPYVRVSGLSRNIVVNESAEFIRSVRRDGAINLFSLRDRVLHAGDEALAGYLTFSAGVLDHALRIRYGEIGDDALSAEDLWVFGNGSVFVNQTAENRVVEQFELVLSVGAENAPASEFRKVIQKSDLISWTLNAWEPSVRSFAQR